MSPLTFLRISVVDWRVWGLTGLLLGWYVLGTVAPDGSLIHLTTAPIFSLMALYYTTLGLILGGMGGPIPFWTGFVLYCGVVAAGIVWLVEKGRTLF